MCTRTGECLVCDSDDNVEDDDDKNSYDIVNNNGVNRKRS